jgi:hypothetical protein
MKKMSFIVAFFAIVAGIASAEVFYNTDIDENTYDWTTYSDEYTSLEDLEWGFKDNPKTNRFVMTLNFTNGSLLASMGVFYAIDNSSTIKPFYFKKRLTLQYWDKICVWFEVTNSPDGLPPMRTVHKIEKL